MKDKIIAYIKNNWKVIIELSVVLTAIIALFQFFLQKDQFEQQQSQYNEILSQKPLLEYYTDYSLSSLDESIILNKSSDLTNQYYNKIFYSNVVTDDNYIKYAQSILPLEMSLEPRQVIYQIFLKNSGAITSNKIRIKVETNRPINEININSVEESSIVQGNLGDNVFIFEIDRIVASSKITISLKSNFHSSVDKQDKIILKSSYLYDYDSKGNITSKTNALGQTTRFIYDNNNRIIEKIDPLGRKTEYKYDDAGNLISFIDPVGRETRYSYDELGRRIQQIDPNNNITSYTYDANGNIVKTETSNSNQIVNDPVQSSSNYWLDDPFPKIEYVPAEEPSIKIEITSNEGVARQIK